MAALRDEVQEIANRLLALNERVLPLDAIAEHVGSAAVTTADLDALFDALEAAGRVIGDPEAGRASEGLRALLASARELKRRLGRTPTAQEVARHSGLSLAAVRLALLFAKVAQR
jgi:hypothetical protein